MSSEDQLTEVDVAAREGLEKMGYTQELSRSRGLLGILFSKRPYGSEVIRSD